MRNSYYALAAAAALTVMAFSTEKASAQYYSTYSYYPNTYYVPAYSYGYAPAYRYAYAPAYSYAYAPAYSYGYYRPSGINFSYGSGYYGRGYGWNGYPGYYGGYGRGYGRSYSGFSVGIGPISYSNYRYSGGRGWRGW
jgi:hypothetical protein